MAYQVTARKWRPQSFDDVVEQRHVTRTLKNAIRLQRIAQAYLFAGTRGVGKTTTARILAKALNCEQGPTEYPCNICSSCLEITQGTSLDIVEIDGASNRGIDEIRELRERLHYLPSRGRYKVYIIDEIHMLTKEAFNALLKTLEEPPGHVVFVFATTELEKIPQTIISRCQRFEFKRVSLAGIVEQLDQIARKETIQIARASLLRIARVAEGSMRDAQSLLDQVVAYCGLQVEDHEVAQVLGEVGNDSLVECLHALVYQDAASALQIAHRWQEDGYEPLSILRALLEGLRHLVIIKTVSAPEILIPLGEADFAAMQQLAQSIEVEEIYGVFHALSTIEQSMRQANNPFLVLEMALVRASCIGRVQPLQTILDHLQRLDAFPPASSPSLPASPQEKPVFSVRSEKPEFLSGSKNERKINLSPLPSFASNEEQIVENQAIATEKSTYSDADFWEALQRQLAQRRPSVAAFLQAGQIVSRDDQELVIGFTKQHIFYRDNIEEDDNRKVIGEIVQTLSGRPLRVKIELLSEGNGKADNRQILPAHFSKKNIDEEEKKSRNEFKQAVIDIFNATPL